MARVLFENVTYDPDKQQIVDFRLKPWADQYLVLRASLYGDDDDVIPPGGTDDGGDLRDPGGPSEGENDNRSPLKSTSELCPIGPMRQGIPTSCGRDQLRYVAHVHRSKSVDCTAYRSYTEQTRT